MDDILEKIPMMIEMAGQGLMLLVAVVSFVVRITPTKSDDKKVQKYLDMAHKLIQKLPSIGVNTRTKELEKFYEEHRAPDAEKPQS